MDGDCVTPDTATVVRSTDHATRHPLVSTPRAFYCVLKHAALPLLGSDLAVQCIYSRSCIKDTRTNIVSF